MKKPEGEKVDCHVSEDECLLPEWAKKLKQLLEEKQDRDQARQRA